MPSEAWWEAQERLHRRLQSAAEKEDEDERDEARRKAWENYNKEREQDS